MNSQAQNQSNNDSTESEESSSTEPILHPPVKTYSESVKKTARSPTKNASKNNSFADLVFENQSSKIKTEDSSIDEEVIMNPILDQDHRAECDLLIKNIKESWSYKEKKKYVKHHQILTLDFNEMSIDSGIANFLYKQRSINGKIPDIFYFKVSTSIKKRDSTRVRLDRQQPPLSQM